MTNLEIKLDIFEGPFDLLLKLIEKNKIDIYDIPISKLTDDYLFYLKNIKKTNMEETSNFIIMASILLEIKSKMLLPKENIINNEKENDPREELVNKLIEYKKYKLVAENLAKKEVFSEKVLFKNPDFNIINSFEENNNNLKNILDDLDLNKLYEIFQDILKRNENKKDKIRSDFKSITKSLYNINDKINYIKDLIFLKNEVNFNEIFKKTYSKTEAIVTFLALLELIKTKEIQALQNDIFDEIIIKKGDFN